MDETRNILRSIPFTIIQCGIFASLVTGKSLGIIFSIGYFILVELFNKYEKSVTKLLDPNNKLFMRPNIPFDGCGNYANSKYDINSWGMPSGHSQGVCFAAVFWIIYIYKYTNLSSTKKLLSSLTLAFLALSVMYSRFVEGCHNFEQIGIGGFIGSVLGYYFFIFLEKYTDTLKN